MLSSQRVEGLFFGAQRKKRDGKGFSGSQSGSLFGELSETQGGVQQSVFEEAPPGDSCRD